MVLKRKKASRRSVKPRKKTMAQKMRTTPSSSKPESSTRSIACLKEIGDMKHFEESEDCFILECDPYEKESKISLDLKQLRPSSPSDDIDDDNDDDDDDDDDVLVISEKGQVACRDFPHARYQCSKFPFKTSSHLSHCEKCYCYVCDLVAPCKLWSLHCDAENVGHWIDQRNNFKKQ